VRTVYDLDLGITQGTWCSDSSKDYFDVLLGSDMWSAIQSVHGRFDLRFVFHCSVQHAWVVA
jgi:hypothetical protein